MKVKIGPYKNWFGPYQCADLLRFFGVPEETRDNIAKKLPSAPFNWLHKQRSRKVKVVIHEYDTWNMDHTLALIILPMLRQLKKTKEGSPFVDNEDVPEELRVSDEDDGPDDSERFHKRWDYVLNEMIFAFEHIVDQDWELEESQDYDKICKRVKKGTTLFGKYFQNLWD